MHIRKGHNLEPSEVVEKAFGESLSPAERQTGTPQRRRANDTMDRINESSRSLRRTHQKRIQEMEKVWRERANQFDEVMKERIKNITEKRRYS